MPSHVPLWFHNGLSNNWQQQKNNSRLPFFSFSHKFLFYLWKQFLKKYDRNLLKKRRRRNKNKTVKVMSIASPWTVFMCSLFLARWHDARKMRVSKCLDLGRNMQNNSTVNRGRGRVQFLTDLPVCCGRSWRKVASLWQTVIPGKCTERVL